MNNFENYLFWRSAYYFIKEHEFRIVRLSENQQELWLENKDHKTVQAIRLLRYDLAWSNWMVRDIERVSRNGELIRKQLFMRDISVLNLYFSPYGPVDDDSFIDKPYLHPESKKTKVISKIVERQNYSDQFAWLGRVFLKELPAPVEPDYESFSEETDRMKRSALHEANNRTRKERALFEYGKPFFTYIFMAVQILIFLLMEWAGGSKSSIILIDFGAKFNPLILEGEWWRFITPMFLHIGFLHLFMNSLALYYLGTVVERIFGNFRFLFIYLIAGFGGTIASFLFSSSISAGASGAIFGCFGALLYFGYIYPKLFFRTMGLNIIIILAINLSLGFTISGIDNAGHIGGLAAGFLATAIVHFPKQKKPARQVLFLVLTIAAVVSSLFYGFNHQEKVTDENSVFVLSQYYLIKGEGKKAYEYMISSHYYEDHPSPEYLMMLAEVEININKFDEAKQHLLRAVAQDPNLHEAHYLLAQIYGRAGNLEKAVEHLQKAVELDPYNRQYSEQLDMLKQRKEVFF